MNTSAPLIGFDRYVELAWCQTALKVAIETATQEDLIVVVADALPGKESQRKTLDILKRLSTKPFPVHADFIVRGLAIYREQGEKVGLPLFWGAAIASYPFFGKTAEITGRLLSLQDDCSIKEVQRRIAEMYGERNGIERAVARIIQSQANWGVIERNETEKRISSIGRITIEHDVLASWLVEAVLRYSGASVSLTALLNNPILYPFSLPSSLSYILSNNPNLMLHSDGPNNLHVRLSSH